MSGGNRVSAGQAEVRLERRARLLLRAYPAEYRRERGEEIIGTQLYLAAALALLVPAGWLILRHRARPRPLRP